MMLQKYVISAQQSLDEMFMLSFISNASEIMYEMVLKIFCYNVDQISVLISEQWCCIFTVFLFLSLISHQK